MVVCKKSSRPKKPNATRRWRRLCARGAFITRGESGCSTDFAERLTQPAMRDTSHHHLTHFLAPARIARYRSFLNLKTDAQVYRAYSWNYALSAMVFPLLGCIEMHLRDAIHQVMSQRYAPIGTKHHDYPWYDDTQPQHYPFSKQAKMSIDGILLNKKTLARKRPAPTTDDVIADLTFGFWTNFFRTLSPIDAPSVVPRILPFHPIQNPKKWGSPVNRHELGSHLQIANMFRNRVAHHEPLFKFRYRGTYPRKVSDGLSNLRNCMDYCLSISDWINERAGHTLRQSDWFKHFEVLSTVGCFDQWIRCGQPPAYHYFV